MPHAFQRHGKRRAPAVATVDDQYTFGLWAWFIARSLRGVAARSALGGLIERLAYAGEELLPRNGFVM